MNTINNAEQLSPGLSASLDNKVSGEAAEVWAGSGEKALGKLLPGPVSNRWFSMLLMVPAAIAFSISCYLAYVAMTSNKIAACDGGIFDCTHVFNSKFAKFMGVPVGLMAAATYFTMLVALIRVSVSDKKSLVNRVAWGVVVFCGISAGLAAIYFTSIQAFVLEHFCPWCLGAHACGFVIAIALFIRRPVGVMSMLACTAVAASGIAGMALTQFSSEEVQKFEIQEIKPVVPAEGEEDIEVFEPDLFEAPMDAQTQPANKKSGLSIVDQALFAFATGLTAPTSMVTYQEETKQEEKKTEAKKERRTVTISGSVKLYTSDWPMLGSPDAKYIFVEMFDYACPHCRRTHAAIRGAREEMGDEVGVMVLPVPLNSMCNNTVSSTNVRFSESCQMAELAVACWRCDAEKFDVFHEWMFEGDIAPNYFTAKAKVEELVGKEAIDAELKKEAAKKYVQRHVQLYKRAGSGSVPKIMFPTSNVLGEYTSTSGLVQLIKERAK